MYRNTVYTDMSVPEYCIYRYICTGIPYLPICDILIIGISVSATRYTVYTDICNPVYYIYRYIYRKYRYISVFTDIYLYITVYSNLLKLYVCECCMFRFSCAWAARVIQCRCCRFNRRC